MLRSTVIRGSLLSCLAAFAAIAPAEIIDRIAVTVDDTVITESEILRQIRLAAFQNGEKPDFRPEKKRDAADKLVDQTLIRREIQTAKYETVQSADVAPAMGELEKRHGGAAGFRKALADYGLTENEVREQIKWQLTLVPFIDVRFKPGVQISERDLREYYEKTLLPEWRKTGTGTPPSFEESRESIQEIMTEQRADQALDFWLGGARRLARIKYHPEAFK